MYHTAVHKYKAPVLLDNSAQQGSLLRVLKMTAWPSGRYETDSRMIRKQPSHSTIALGGSASELVFLCLPEQRAYLGSQPWSSSQPALVGRSVNLPQNFWDQNVELLGFCLPISPRALESSAIARVSGYLPAKKRMNIWQTSS